MVRGGMTFGLPIGGAMGAAVGWAWTLLAASIALMVSLGAYGLERWREGS